MERVVEGIPRQATQSLDLTLLSASKVVLFILGVLLLLNTSLKILKKKYAQEM